MIENHRKNFNADVEVLCKLCEEVLPPRSCSPNLHSLHHMIRKLVAMKGHPTFEMIVERLVCALNSAVATILVLLVFPLLSILLYMLMILKVMSMELLNMSFVFLCFGYLCRWE